MGGGLLVGVNLVKVVSLLNGWSSDCGRHIRRFAPYIFLTVCALGGCRLVGVSLVKVVRLLDGRNFDCERHTQRFAPYFFVNGLRLERRSSCGY